MLRTAILNRTLEKMDDVIENFTNDGLKHIEHQIFNFDMEAYTSKAFRSSLARLLCVAGNNVPFSIHKDIEEISETSSLYIIQKIFLIARKSLSSKEMQNHLYVLSKMHNVNLKILMQVSNIAFSKYGNQKFGHFYISSGKEILWSSAEENPMSMYEMGSQYRQFK